MASKGQKFNKYTLEFRNEIVSQLSMRINHMVIVEFVKA